VKRRPGCGASGGVQPDALQELVDDLRARLVEGELSVKEAVSEALEGPYRQSLFKPMETGRDDRSTEQAAEQARNAELDR
jgi:hypothetical protein